MNDINYKMDQAIQALHGAAKGIAAGIDEETISSKEVLGMLGVIADQMQQLSDQLTHPDKS